MASAAVLADCMRAAHRLATPLPKDAMAPCRVGAKLDPDAFGTRVAGGGAIMQTTEAVIPPGLQLNTLVIAAHQMGAVLIIDPAVRDRVPRWRWW